jgi:hypothetical protein
MKLKGEYKITLYSVDGADSLQYFLDSVFSSCENYINFSGRPEYTTGRGWPKEIKFNCDLYSNKLGDENYSSWGFVLDTNINKLFTDKTRLYTYILLEHINNYNMKKYLWYWDIKLLEREDLWLEREENGKKYILHLKKNKAI